jgi:hypothetical protein
MVPGTNMTCRARWGLRPHARASHYRSPSIPTASAAAAATNTPTSATCVQTANNLYCIRVSVLSTTTRKALLYRSHGTPRSAWQTPRTTDLRERQRPALARFPSGDRRRSHRRSDPLSADPSALAALRRRPTSLWARLFHTRCSISHSIGPAAKPASGKIVNQSRRISGRVLGLRIGGEIGRKASRRGYRTECVREVICYRTYRGDRGPPARTCADYLVVSAPIVAEGILPSHLRLEPLFLLPLARRGRGRDALATMLHSVGSSTRAAGTSRTIIPAAGVSRITCATFSARAAEGRSRSIRELLCHE